MAAAAACMTTRPLAELASCWGLMFMMALKAGSMKEFLEKAPSSSVMVLVRSVP